MREEGDWRAIRTLSVQCWRAIRTLSVHAKLHRAHLPSHVQSVFTLSSLDGNMFSCASVTMRGADEKLFRAATQV
jgi:hypothetical protein